MKLFLTVIAAFLFLGVAHANAADRYWVGGTANWDATAGTKWAATSGGAAGQSVPTTADNCFFNAASGAVTVTISAAASCLNLNFTGFTGTLAGTSTLNIAGGLTLGASMIRTYTGAITFSATSGTHTITPNGILLDSAITFNGVGGSWILGGNFVTGSVRATTLTAGSLDANDFNVTTGQFTSANANVRSLAMGSGTWTLTGTAVVWNMSTVTNFTLDPESSTVIVSNSAASSKSIIGGSTTTHALNDVVIASATANALQLSNVRFRNLDVQATGASAVLTIVTVTVTGDLDFSGYTGSLVTTTAPLRVGGSFTFSSTMSTTGALGITALTATSGTHVVTTNGTHFNGPLVLSGVGGIWELADELVVEGPLSLLAGTLSANDQDVTASSFSSPGSATRSLDMGSGTWTLDGAVNTNTALWETSSSGLSLMADETQLNIEIPASPSWGRVGGDNIRGSWDDLAHGSAGDLLVHEGMLYVGMGEATGDADVWQFDGATWTKVGGDGLNSSWNTDYEVVFSLGSHNGLLYAALGTTIGDAEVWEYDGATWTKVGGDGLNSSWNTNYEWVESLASVNDKLYAGLGSSAGDAEIWEYDGATWLKVGGDGENSSWPSGTQNRVQALTTHADSLYVGLGGSVNGDAEVWEYDGATWAKVGGDGANSSWADSAFSTVATLAVLGDQVYAGISRSNVAEVWEYDGATWIKVGGGSLNGSWADSTTSGVFALGSGNGKLYAGLHNNGPIWEFDGVSWVQIGGSELNGSWPGGNAYFWANDLEAYEGRIYASLQGGLGGAEVWEYAAKRSFIGGGHAYGSVTISGSGDEILIQGDVTFSSLNLSTPHTLSFSSGSTTTVGTLSADGATLIGSSWNLVKSDSTDAILESITLRGSHASPANTWYAIAGSTDQGDNTGWRFCIPEDCDPPAQSGSSIGAVVWNPVPAPTPAPSAPSPSDLAVYGLQEGDIISAGGSGDPDVYIVNSWGYKRLFLNPVIFGFYGHLSEPQSANSVLPIARDTFPTSGLFRNCETNDQAVYAVEITSEDSGILHHVQLSGESAASEDPEFFKKVFCINSNEFNWYPKGTPFISLNQVPVYMRE